MKKYFVIILIVLLSIALACAVGCDKKNDENDIYGIFVSKAPDKVNYFAGESLDISGCEITVRTKSHDDYTVKVTPAMVSGFSSALGNHTLTITYIVGDTPFMTTQVITVTTRVANSAVITTPPNKTTFIEGQRIDLSGLIAEVTFSDKTVADRHFGAFTLNKSIAEMGMTEVELRLDKVVLKVNIEVIPKVISGLTATALPNKTVYTEGEYFDPTGLEVYSMYNDGTRGYLVEFEVDNANIPLVATQNSVIVRDRYSRDFSLEIPVTINVLEISDIELLDKDKIRTSYLKSSLPDFSDIKAKIVFGDGTEKVVDSSSLIFDLPSDQLLSVGEYTVKVKYLFASANEKFDSFVINVVEKKQPIALKVETNNEFSPLYNDGEEIGLWGIAVYVYYNDSTDDWIIYENQINEEIEGFSMTEFADKDNPYIEFRIDDIVERLPINVNFDESDFDAPEA